MASSDKLLNSGDNILKLFSVKVCFKKCYLKRKREGKNVETSKLTQLYKQTNFKPDKFEQKWVSIY